MDSEDDELLLLGVVAIVVSQKKIRKERRIRVSPYLQGRKKKGRFIKDYPDMLSSPQIFKENFRVLPAQFEELFILLEPRMKPKVNSHPHDNLSPREKFCVTLEFLASGTLLRHIASCYRISRSAVSKIIYQTCHEIYEVLKRTQLNSLTAHKLEEVTNGYHIRWNFPHCLGAIDGKHIAIKCPRNGGSCFFNYKGFHSLVLMAVADHSYKFLYADIGAYGSEGDATVFRTTQFGKQLLGNKLPIPGPRRLGNQLLPHFFVADYAFPLHKNIMKPYTPDKRRNLERDERIFNYRLSRARRCVENSFGIMCARFYCLMRTMFVSPDTAQKVVGACVVLHNYLINVAAEDYAPVGFADTIDAAGNVVEGGWRKAIPESSMFNTNLQGQNCGRASDFAKAIRNLLKEYVNSEVGSVEWQNNII